MMIRRKFVTVFLALVLGLSFSSEALALGVSGVSNKDYIEGADKAAPFYNPLVVSTVNLTLPQASFDKLNNDPGTSIYQTASVTITTADGVVTTLNNIGVRLKGQATRTNLYGKAPLKLKFDAFVAGQKFMGLTRMTLNSMVQDPSFVHEASAYRLYRAMGIIAPRTSYSWVTLNGVDFGLYANIESIDSQMLKRWVTPKHLYSSNCYGADLTYYQSGCYDTNYGDADRTDLNAAIAVSQYDGETWWTEVNKVADMTAVINLMATDIYTSNWDGYTDVVQNNYFIVFDKENKLKIIPWGQDGAFPSDPSAQLDWLGRGPAFRNWGNGQRSVMLRKCVAYDPCANLLIKAEAAAKAKAEQIDMIAFKNKLAAVINTAYVSHETRSYSNVDSARGWQNWLDTFFPYRTNALTSFLQTRPIDTPTFTLTGDPTWGSTITASANTWDFSASLSYQWYRDGQVIPGQTTNKYVIQTDDLSKILFATVTASKPNFPSITVTSAPMLISSPKAASAAIAGSAIVGGSLAATPENSLGVQVSYRWLRAGKAITGATSSSYTPTALDYNKNISVTTTVVQPGYDKTITTSSAVLVGPGSLSPISASISGINQVGMTLSATTNATSDLKLAFLWLKDGQAISGGTRATYTLKPTDVTHAISVRITGSKVGYVATSSTASSQTVLEAPLTKTPIPTITGLTGLGKTITANAGTWDTSVKLSYQWLRNSVPIANATGRTYKITSADLSKSITVQVTGTKLGYQTKTVVSVPLAIG